MHLKKNMRLEMIEQNKTWTTLFKVDPDNKHGFYSTQFQLLVFDIARLFCTLV